MDVTKKPVTSTPFTAEISTSTLQEIANKKVMAALGQLPALADATEVAVACSGGVDSAVLGLHAVLWARLQGKTLHFFHVHHGLQRPAEGWMRLVEDLAQQLGVACHTMRVQVDLGQGDGMESAARDARYLAFTQLSALTKVRHILLGHHLDDQAETVLLRLLRGTGVTGMGAMASQIERDDIHYLRPLLDTPRAELIKVAEKFSDLTSWYPVCDPTNIQDDYTRGALRDRLVPHLNERWQGWQRILSRHAQQSQEAAEILDEVAAADFAQLNVDVTDFSFDLAAWRKLSHARQALVLRYWLDRQGLLMPTQARLNDMLRQLRQLHALGFDRKMRIKHSSTYVCCSRGRVFLSADDHL